MPDSRKQDWSPPADVAMDIIAMCDGDIEKASAYAAELQVFLKGLSSNELTALQTQKPDPRSARRKGLFGGFLEPKKSILGKKSRASNDYMFDTGSGLVRVMEYDDEPGDALGQRDERLKRKPVN